MSKNPKEFDELNKKLQSCYFHLKNQSDNISSLKEELIFLTNRYDRIVSILDKQINLDVATRIEKTYKKINVLTSIVKNDMSIEITFYNLDDIQPKIKYAMHVTVKVTTDGFAKIDIVGGSSQGHGTLGMAYIFEYIKNYNQTLLKQNNHFRSPIKQIKGSLNSPYEDNKQRQIRFYAKHGFTINFDKNTINKNLL
ncbi:hypothetical protein [Cellulophaga baltica]|uniref:hypothetical protein n=1 Tax=Cellulophaga baltica TaxID=76594 RepID=UPI002494B5FF|nr:hypothetical protein [Cellulophaga baltica]